MVILVISVMVDKNAGIQELNQIYFKEELWWGEELGALVRERN